MEADRGRADEYYLAEGTGIARRYTATGGVVAEAAALSGDGYETWVAGVDPDTGVPRGRLRTDERAVRFVEVVVNGPKTWSLAAALHPDIAQAYDAAQDRAAKQIIAWLSEHATTRVGRRGAQVQMPVELLEAVTVRHYTSRAGDPHRHLHLQILARVFAAGKWRGLHTIGVRDALGAINGIGHAAMACDPELNASFAANGYTRGATGELLELAPYVGPMSARRAQIAGNVDRYEREWMQAHPGESPGLALRRAWEARAWAEGRPDKVPPRPGEVLEEGWRADLTGLGFRPPSGPLPLASTAVGALDRDGAAERVLARLGAARSAWNAADIRGEAEQLITAAGIVADAAVRIELAEDLTARALHRCVPLLRTDGVPEHIRSWTSAPVLAVEADLTARLAARAVERPVGVESPEPTPPVDVTAAVARLDPGQAAAVTALASKRALIVIEGAAGAGKTTTLAATRTLLTEQGRRLVVVTPTLKAAKVAAAEVGAAAGSAARLAFEYGWRWNDDGAWTRLAHGDPDPVTGYPFAGPAESARLRAGDLLVVDEAGMLDQDTARAVLTIADECQVDLALLGDRYQLAAVGRGGVLDLAAAQVAPTEHLTLVGVHRFTRTDGTGRTTPDSDYAELTLAMRAGTDPGTVFDTLLARGQIQLHAEVEALREALAAEVAERSAGERVAVVVSTREQAAALNAAIRERLVTAGRVDDWRVVVTGTGEQIGVGDRIATRRNDRELQVANRDTWTVTGVDRDGGLLVTPEGTPPDTSAGGGPAAVAPAGEGARVLPADYVTTHVELAYATTVHGAQGDTVTAAHLQVSEDTGAAAAYVGMTRGREANTAHLVAVDPAEAREQWIAVFARDRADLGPAHAAQQAATEAARYAPARPLDQALAELAEFWSVEQRCVDQLALLQPWRDTLRLAVAQEAGHAGEFARLDAACRQAAHAFERAQQVAQASARAVAAEADGIRDRLLAAWDNERATARAAARIVLDDPGRFNLRRAAVTRTREHLDDWANRWRPHRPDLPTDRAQLARVADWFDDRAALWRMFDTAARRAAEQRHPEHAQLCAAADTAQSASEAARRALAHARSQRDERLAPLGPFAWSPDPEAQLADLEREIDVRCQQLTDARTRITGLTAEPILRAQPPDRLARERDAWRAGHNAHRAAARMGADRTSSPTAAVRSPRSDNRPSLYRRRTPDRSVLR
ncbi:TrwC relaxase [Blastococcus sp. TF02A-26]|nr:TrwC relaxase [Blastococcus sp. TF02A-26]